MEQQVNESQEQMEQAMTENMDSPLTYAEREELKNLSKLFYGSSSRWQKLSSRGQLTAKTDQYNQPVVIGHSKRVRGNWGKLTPIHLMEYVTTSPREQLNMLRAENAKIEAAIEAQRKAREAEKLAAAASGVAETSSAEPSESGSSS